MARPHTPQKSDSASRVARTPISWPRSLAIWAAGARSEVLARARSEQLLVSAIGAAVIFTAFYQGFAGTFALSYALHTPMSSVWVLGVIWAATFLNIDRLVLMIGSGRRGWLALLPRLVLTVLLGIVMAEVMTLRIFAPEVTQELAITQQTALTQQIRSINHTDTAKVNADEQDIATWQAKENTLKQGDGLASL